MLTFDDYNYSLKDYTNKLRELEEILDTHNSQSYEFPKEFYEYDIDEIISILENKAYNYAQRTNKHIRNRNNYFRMKKLYETTKHSWRAPVEYVEDKKYYKKTNYGAKRKKYGKRASNRKIRRISNKTYNKIGDTLPSGSNYKKIYESWNIFD